MQFLCFNFTCSLDLEICSYNLEQKSQEVNAGILKSDLLGMEVTSVANEMVPSFNDFQSIIFHGLELLLRD